ncbi:transmembrane protein [Cystoisospora suis]|uniref:BOS complex subunit TMEM147 n=1 Tax=Cystoisospora suis TaxID=483139 RepID=A0A2C6KGG7_9APIC|nr:transmembrane protein [Cystoisospora suis]
MCTYTCTSDSHAFVFPSYPPGTSLYSTFHSLFALHRALNIASLTSPSHSVISSSLFFCVLSLSLSWLLHHSSPNFFPRGILCRMSCPSHFLLLFPSIHCVRCPFRCLSMSPSIAVSSQSRSRPPLTATGAPLTFLLFDSPSCLSRTAGLNKLAQGFWLSSRLLLIFLHSSLSTRIPIHWFPGLANPGTTLYVSSLVVASLVPNMCYAYFVCEILTQILLGALEVCGIYVVLHHRIAMSIDAEARLLSVGLGWASAHSLFTCLLPLLSSVRTPAFQWRFFYGALSASVSTMSLLALTAIVFLVTRRKQQWNASIPAAGALGVVLLLFPFLSNRLVLGSAPSSAPGDAPVWWGFLAFQAAVTAYLGLLTRRMYQQWVGISAAGPAATTPQSQRMGSFASARQTSDGGEKQKAG